MKFVFSYNESSNFFFIIIILEKYFLTISFKMWLKKTIFNCKIKNLTTLELEIIWIKSAQVVKISNFNNSNFEH